MMSNFKSLYSHSLRRQKGLSLLEVMLGMIILMVSVAGVYSIMQRAQTTANVEREMSQMTAIADGVLGEYMANGTFAGIDTISVADSNISGIRRDGGRIVHAFNGDIVVRPATVGSADDAFDLVYHGLGSTECLNLVSSLYPKTYQIMVGEVSDLDGTVTTEGTHVQFVGGANEGRLVGEDTLAGLCSDDAFEDDEGIVAFRIYRPSPGVIAEPPAVCTCSPTTDRRRATCPLGERGTIIEERTSTCTGGTAECPVAVWSAWSVVDNTCSPDTGLTIVLTPVLDPNPVCLSRTETRNLACPPTQVGTIVEERTASCPTSTSPASDIVYGGWVEVQNTCSVVTDPIVTPCTSSTERQSLACPTGEGGAIVQERQSTCPSPTGSPVWGAWIEISRNCSTDCVITGNCCVPSSEERVSSGICPAGSYGSISDQERRTSTCSTPTATPVWGGWFVTSTSGTCTLCPATTTQEDFIWVPDTQACPAGQSGVLTIERQQRRTRTVSYSCPAGTATLPAPTTSAWSAGVDTGATRNLSTADDTCVATGCPVGFVKNYYWDQWQYPDAGQDSGCNGYPGFGGDAYDTLPPSEVCEASIENELRNPNFGCVAEGTSATAYWICASTCVPDPSCNIAAGSVFNWTVGGNSCTYTQAAATTITNGSNLSATDSIAPTTGNAAFACNSGTISMTPNAGATCNFTPASCNVPAGTVFNWTVSGNNCTYTQAAATTITSGNNLSAIDSIAPDTGTAAFNCSNGALSPTPNAGATCINTPPCPGPQTWTSFRSLACPTGQVGEIIQQATTTATAVCPTSPQQYSLSTGPWTVYSNTCTNACLPSSEFEERTVACPAGYSSGSTVERRTRDSTCATPTSSPVWGSWSSWAPVSTTCTAATCTLPSSFGYLQNGSGNNWTYFYSDLTPTEEAYFNIADFNSVDFPDQYSRPLSEYACGAAIHEDFVEYNSPYLGICDPANPYQEYTVRFESDGCAGGSNPYDEGGRFVTYFRICRSGCATVTPQPVCQPDAPQTRTLACPPGQSGFIEERRVSQCNSAGSWSSLGTAVCAGPSGGNTFVTWTNFNDAARLAGYLGGGSPQLAGSPGPMLIAGSTGWTSASAPFPVSSPTGACNVGDVIYRATGSGGCGTGTNWQRYDCTASGSPTVASWSAWQQTRNTCTAIQPVGSSGTSCFAGTDFDGKLYMQGGPNGRAYGCDRDGLFGPVGVCYQCP